MTAHESFNADRSRRAAQSPTRRVLAAGAFGTAVLFAVLAGLALVTRQHPVLFMVPFVSAVTLYAVGHRLRRGRA